MSRFPCGESVIMLAFIAFFTHRWVNGDLSMQPHAHYHPLQLCAAFPPSTTALPDCGHSGLCELRARSGRYAAADQENRMNIYDVSNSVEHLDDTVKPT